MYNLLILEYKYSYLILTKKIVYKNLFLHNNQYNIYLNYFFINYNFKPLFQILINLNFYLSILKLYNFIKTTAIPFFVSLLMLFLLINFFKIEIYTNIGI